jgi:hypothetical protein
MLPKVLENCFGFIRDDVPSDPTPHQFPPGKKSINARVQEEVVILVLAPNRPQPRIILAKKTI